MEKTKNINSGKKTLQLSSRWLPSLTWVMVMVVMSVLDWPIPVSSHGSHSSQPRQRHSGGQVRDHTADTSAKRAGNHQEPSAGFHDSKIVHDTEHINEHLQGKAAVNVSEMSLEELEFHYFKMHDFDNNTKLDGLEILKALTHLLPYDSVDDDDKVVVDARGKTSDEVLKESREKELSYYTEIVDNVLADDDIDDDGFLTYPEYIIARRREEAREMQEELENKSNTNNKQRN